MAAAVCGQIQRSINSQHTTGDGAERPAKSRRTQQTPALHNFMSGFAEPLPVNSSAHDIGDSNDYDGLLDLQLLEDSLHYMLMNGMVPMSKA